MKAVSIWFQGGVFAIFLALPDNAPWHLRTGRIHRGCTRYGNTHRYRAGLGAQVLGLDCPVFYSMFSSM